MAKCPTFTDVGGQSYKMLRSDLMYKIGQWVGQVTRAASRKTRNLTCNQNQRAGIIRIYELLSKYCVQSQLASTGDDNQCFWLKKSQSLFEKQFTSIRLSHSNFHVSFSV